MTARFGRDHAAVIAALLKKPTHYHLYMVQRCSERSCKGFCAMITVSGVGRSFPTLLELLKQRKHVFPDKPRR